MPQATHVVDVGSLGPPPGIDWIKVALLKATKQT